MSYRVLTKHQALGKGPSPPRTPRYRHRGYPHSEGRETGAQKGEVTGVRSCEYRVLAWDLNLSLSVGADFLPGYLHSCCLFTDGDTEV